MNIFSNNEMNDDSHSPSNYMISKNSSFNDVKIRFKKKSNVGYNKKITSLYEIERIEDNISEITSKFLQNHQNVTKVLQFRNKYKHLLQGNYIDLVLIIKDFPDFNLFDFITVYQIGQYPKNEQKKILQARNNIILSILTVAKEAQLFEENNLLLKKESSTLSGKKGSSFKRNSISGKKILKEFEKEKEIFFSDLSFLDPLADEFKTLIIEDTNSKYSPKLNSSPKNSTSPTKNKNTNSYDYEVEIFFLSLLEYKDKARTVLQKFNKYFKTFLLSLNLPTKFNFDTFITLTIEKAHYTEFTDTEIIIIRKILSNIAKRKFYHGLEFLLKINPYYILMSEGRIWKNIGLYLNNNQVYILWKLYESNLQEVRSSEPKNTLDIEYENRLSELRKKASLLNGKIEKESSKKNKINYTINELEKEKTLFFVTCLKELIVIFFQYELKELVRYFFDRFQQRSNSKIPVEIYEICLDFDEDISIDIMDKALTTKNVKAEYMQMALIKKYFRLARGLLKFKICKEFLNSPPPKEENYLWILYKQQIKKKNEEFTKVILNKQNKNEGDRLISLLHENTNKSNMQNSQQSIGNSQINLISDINSMRLAGVSHTKIQPFSSLLDQFKKSSSSCGTISPLQLNEKSTEKGEPKQDDSQATQLKKEPSKKVKNSKPRPSVTYKMESSRKFSFHFNLEKKLQNGGIDSNNPSCKKSVLSSHLDKSKTDEEIKLANLKELVPKINVQQILIEQLRFGDYIFDALCLLSSINENKINLDLCDKTCQHLMVFTTSDDVITKCPHPLIVIALAAEYLTKIGKLNRKIQYKTTSITSELLKLGASIQSSMKNEEMLNYYLREQTDHIGRSALEVYAENNYSLLLNDISVGDIAGKMWYGNGYEQSIFRFFRLTRIIQASIVYEPFETVIQKDYLPKDTTYIFQFYHYIQNCSVRFTMWSVITTVCTLLYQYVIYLYVEQTKADIEKYYQNPISGFVTSVNCVAYLSLLSSVLRVLYFYKTGRRVKLETFEAATEFIFFLSILFSIVDIGEYIYPRENEKDLNFLINGIIYATIITTAWMRVISIFMKTYSFGSFFRITFAIIWHVVAFLLITFGLTFIFAQVYTVFFQKSNDDFFEIYQGFVTLFNTAFGQVEFLKFTNLTVYGYICLMLFTTVSNIILFNLIVCIINILFNGYEEKADAENRSILILSHERIKWDDRFGLLILMPPPLNLISILFIIILLIYSHHNDDSDIIKLNMIFSKISYFFIALLYFIFLFVIGIIVYPFAYLKSIVSLIYEDGVSINKRTFGKGLISIITIPLRLLFFFFEDLFLFWCLVFKKPTDQDEKNTKKIISGQYILALRKVLIKLKFKDKKKIIPINELYIKLGLITKRSNSKYTIQKGKNEDMYSISSKLNNNSNHTSIIPSIVTSNESVISKTSFSDYDRQYVKETMKYLIDKIVDVDGFVDIDRTLTILPFRVKYSQAFLKDINFTNVRVLQRGLRKYFFLNDETNQVYTYKKLQLLIYKLLIKFKLIYKFIPKETFEIIKQNFNNINEDPQYEKTAQVLGMVEQRDDISEYDDTGEMQFFGFGVTSEERATE